MNVEHIASRAAEATSPAHLHELFDKGAKGAQTAAKAVAAYASLRTLMGAVQSLHPARMAMSALGIQRRASLPVRIVTSAGLLAAGAAIGAGAALLLAPTSGADLRAALRKRLGREAARAPEEKGTRAEESEADASDGAQHAAGASSNGEAPKRPRAQASTHRRPERA